MISASVMKELRSLFKGLLNCSCSFLKSNILPIRRGKISSEFEVFFLVTFSVTKKEDKEEKQARDKLLTY